MRGEYGSSLGGFVVRDQIISSGQYTSESKARPITVERATGVCIETRCVNVSPLLGGKGVSPLQSIQAKPSRPTRYMMSSRCYFCSFSRGARVAFGQFVGTMPAEVRYEDDKVFSAVTRRISCAPSPFPNIKPTIVLSKRLPRWLPVLVPTPAMPAEICFQCFISPIHFKWHPLVQR